MKKILVFSLTLITLSAAASAQRNPGLGLRKGQLVLSERTELRQDAFRTRGLQRKTRRDGIVTPIERRRIRRSTCDTRRDAFRFRHNGRRRII